VQKLGIKPGFRIFAAGAPAAYRDIVGKLPAEVTIVTRLVRNAALPPGLVDVKACAIDDI
jgi:hypothetical protein